jgi:serine phosphatase RsbU (regulator of sigma subunit)
MAPESPVRPVPSGGPVESAPARRARVSRGPRTRTQQFVGFLWRTPLMALPFTLFFGVLYARGLRDWGMMYLISLTFSYTIGFGVWAVQALDRGPRATVEPLSAAERRRALMFEILKYVGVGVAGAFVAAGILHFTLLPGFLGTARNVLVLSAYALLFSVLMVGLSFGFHFYQQALDKARAEEELNLARRIQRSFLITNFPAMPRLEVHAVNVSSKQVSGDFYDVVPAGESAFLLCIADVSGKGVPAALLGAMLQAALRTQAHLTKSVAEMARNINQLICNSSPNGQFATVFLARVEEDTLRITYTNAGHNAPVLFRRNGTQELLDRGGMVVGIMDSAEFEEGALLLEPGDRLLFYTDGISEAMDGHQEMFGEERLYSLVQSIPADLSTRELLERVLAGHANFLGGREPQDDMTLMALRTVGPSR